MNTKLMKQLLALSLAVATTAPLAQAMESSAALTADRVPSLKELTTHLLATRIILHHAPESFAFASKTITGDVKTLIEEETKRIKKVVSDLIVKHGSADAALLAVSKDGCSDMNAVAVLSVLLATPGINVNAQGSFGWTPLHKAARNGHTNVVQALLATPGITVNAQNKYGMTPLYCAAHNGHLAIVKALLAIPGIDVNARDEYSDTPLHDAARNGHLIIVQTLLAACNAAGDRLVNVNTQTKYDETPLHLAAYKDHTAIVQALLAAGANVNAQTKHKETPLHVAAYKGHFDSVKILLAAGADKNIENEFDETPTKFARSNGFTELADFIDAYSSSSSSLQQ